MILVRNIYYMLSYAFQTLNESCYKKLATEEFHNVAELCAAILVKGVAAQIKRGLRYEYNETLADMTTIRGRLDLAESIKSGGIWKKRPMCVLDEFTVNSYPNRIIKTTLFYLITAPITQTRRREIRRLLNYLGDVEPIAPRDVNWNLRFDRNYSSYRMIIGVCYLALRGLIQTTNAGKMKLMEFLDEQATHRLYERFIREYYRKERPKFKVAADYIPWALDEEEGGDGALPVMKSDVTITANGKTLILDAKYYNRPMRTNFGVKKHLSSNLYQIFAYVKNLTVARQLDPRDVAGVLLYAQTDDEEAIESDYTISGSRICTRALDLNRDFTGIATKLNSIVDEFLDER